MGFEARIVLGHTKTRRKVLRLKSTKSQSRPRLYTLAAAARALGISPLTLKALERSRIVSPRYADDSVRQIRIFDDADLAHVLAHYRKKGGFRVLPLRSQS